MANKSLWGSSPTTVAAERRRVFAKRRTVAALTLGTSLALLSACSSSNDPASALGRKTKLVAPGNSGNNSGSGSTTTTPTPTPTPTAAPVPVSGGVYDASIGAGVDADGFASLPLRSGAHRFFVNSATGADSNGCSGSQQPSSPLKSIPAAIACVANGEGDQVLLAEGTSYNQDIGWLAFKQGYSATYPMVISSYDPADPANEAKYGRGDQRNARPVITALQSQLGNGTYNYYAIKGLDFNPGNVASAGFGFIGKAGNVLIENNIFRYTGLTFDTADYPAMPTTQKLIVRNNSIYGMWNTAGRTGGLYVAGYVGPTVEDNVFYHCGWKIGANRDDDPSVGGATVFSHSYYLQTNTTGAIVRRNLSADGAGDGGIARGDSVLTENLFIDNPAAIGLGGGPQYNIDRPTGVSFDASYNAIIGDADVTSSHPLGWAISTTNGMSGSRVHHNLILRSRSVNGSSVQGFSNSASFALPSYAQYDHNLLYLWANSGQTYWTQNDANAGYVHTAYDYNNWDASAQGTNTNSASTGFATPYTAAQLYAALGFADKTAFINYAINHPETHIQRTARSMLFTGYGMN